MNEQRLGSNSAGEGAEGPSWHQVAWPEWILRPPVVLETVDSTNNYALRLARQEHAPEGTLVIAEAQTAGRGRRDRRWFSPRGRSIYASVILRPRFGAPLAQLPTLLAAAAAAAAVQHLYGLPARVKWPNDIQINGRKLGGILTESALSGQRIDYLVVGLGLNCNLLAGEWPEELRRAGTSLALELGRPVARAELLAQVLRILGRDYQCCQQGEGEAAMRGWRNLNVTLGRRVQVTLPTGSLTGTAEDLLSDGSLQLREEGTGRSLRVRLGEIS